jgi:ribosomal protein S18 acetylase RimI-like enzyme
MLDTKLLTPDDWRTLRTIRLSALQESPNVFLSTYEQEEKYDPSRWQAEFVRGDWYVGMAGAASADEPVSMAGITRVPGAPPHECFLEYVWVAPGFRRHGNAFNMINEVLDRLKLSGVRTVFLWVLDGNDGAMRLYEQLGFVSCNHREPLIAFPGRSEELMQRHLGLALSVGGVLWPAGWRILPVLLPTVRAQAEDVVHEHQPGCTVWSHQEPWAEDLRDGRMREPGVLNNLPEIQ